MLEARGIGLHFAAVSFHYGNDLTGPMITTIAELLRKKGSDVLTVDENATVYQAISLMEQHRVGSVVVTNDLDVVGIFTERDYLRRIVLDGRTSRTTLIREVMTQDLITVAPDATVEQCMALMTEHRIRHLPVLKRRQLVGILSIGDVVKQNLEDAKERAAHLEKMVTGSYPG
jgi:CBS domain-containing protein